MKQTIYIPVKAGKEHDGLLYEAGKGGLTGKYLKAIEMPTEKEMVDILVEDIGPTEQEMEFINDEGFFMYNKRILNIAKAITKLMKGEK